MTGNLASGPDEPLFLLDESLTPAVAEALSRVGYRFVTLAAAFGRKGVEDPEIIEWCREQDAAWVHADDRARKEHRLPRLLQEWERRPAVRHYRVTAANGYAKPGVRAVEL